MQGELQGAHQAFYRLLVNRAVLKLPRFGGKQLKWGEKSLLNCVTMGKGVDIPGPQLPLCKVGMAIVTLPS